MSDGSGLLGYAALTRPTMLRTRQSDMPDTFPTGHKLISMQTSYGTPYPANLLMYIAFLI